MVLIVGIGIGHAREQVLILLARQQIAVVERVLAKVGQARIAAVIGDDGEAAVIDLLAVAFRGFLGRFDHRAGQRLGRLGGDQRVRTCITRLHGHGFLFLHRRGCARPCSGIIEHFVCHAVACLEFHRLPHLCPPNHNPAQGLCSDSVLYRTIHRLANRMSPRGSTS